MNRLKIFRAIALIEGVTTIVLFLIAMPLKYLTEIPVPMFPVGMSHGVAWMAYLAAMLICLPGYKFSAWQWLRTFVAALFPFGTFLNDGLIQRRLEQVADRKAEESE